MKRVRCPVVPLLPTALAALAALAALVVAPSAGAAGSVGTPVPFVPVWSVKDAEGLARLHVERLPTAWFKAPGGARAGAYESLGKVLFSSPRLSVSGRVSCSTCHASARDYTDGRSLAAGEQAGVRNSPTLLGVAAWSEYGWTGESDSLDVRILAALRSPMEHGLTAREIRSRTLDAAPKETRDAFEGGGGASPDFASEDPERAARLVSSALATYVGRLRLPSSPFDAFVRDLVAKSARAAPGGAVTSERLSHSAQRGLKLFLGDAACVRCHNGPLFSNGVAHNTGTVSPGEADRYDALVAKAQARARARAPEAVYATSGGGTGGDRDLVASSPDETARGALRVPTLRALARTAPYFHDGSAPTLEAVIEHYASAPPARVGTSELVRPSLTRADKADLVAFLLSLSAEEP